MFYHEGYVLYFAALHWHTCSVMQRNAKRINVTQCNVKPRPNQRNISCKNKTGTRQCTRAVWSTFAEIHFDHPGALIHLGLLKLPVWICDSHITTHTRPTWFIPISENTYVRGMRYLHHEVHELDEYTVIMNFGRLRDILWNVFSSNRLNFPRESSFKGTPLDLALANIFEDLDFLSHYRVANRLNKTARSEIYQRHRHLNLPLDQVHLLPQAHHAQFWNKSNIICSTVFSRSS